MDAAGSGSAYKEIVDAQGGSLEYETHLRWPASMYMSIEHT